MNIFYSETAWPIKAKKHVEAFRDRGMKVCITCPRHMAKMSTLQIYGKSLLKSPEPDPMILKLGTKHWRLELYKWCINDDPGLTMTYFYITETSPY